MRLVLIILFTLIAGSAIYGFSVQGEDLKSGDFFIGIAIAGLFFVWMPLFIYHRWRRRSFRDYMLTKENIDKMREVSREKDL